MTRTYSWLPYLATEGLLQLPLQAALQTLDTI